jgi:sarcosine oxidase
VSEQFEYVVIGLGALGSGTAYHLAKAGCSVLGLEQFELGHERGASHDTSRILRHSYHTPNYVRLTFDAYDDWDTLEADSGQTLVSTVGGLDLFPPDAWIDIEEYASSMAALDVGFERLERDDTVARWPQMSLPEGTRALYQSRGAIVPAARGTAVMQAMARRFGAELRDESPVTSVRDLAADGIEVTVGDGTVRCRRLVVCADAWTNQVLAGLDWQVHLTTTLEQVTYFEPTDAMPFEPGRFPLWIWMDDPCYYGFPTYGEATVKAAEDCGGAEVTGDDRPFEVNAERLARLSGFMATTFPGSGPAIRSKTCLYTLTNDRDFLLGAVPGHDNVLVGLGAGHSFKFSPTIGRMLAEVAATGETKFDLEPFRLDRPGVAADAPILWRM